MFSVQGLIKKKFKNIMFEFHTEEKIREIILDDYFKFLFDEKLCKVSCYKLNNYTHIGSISEYEELKYWQNYLKNENR